MRRPRAEIPDEALLPFRFRPKFEYLLLPEHIHRQGTCDDERNLRVRVAVGVLRIVLKDKSVASFVEPNKFAAHRRVGSRFAVFEIFDQTLSQRILVEKLDNVEWLAPDCQNIQGLVIVALHDFDDLRSAPYPGNPFGYRQQHAELRFFLQAAAYHFEITRLEDMQGKVRAGEKNDV